MTLPKNSNRGLRQDGFTLAEIMVVVAICGVLAAVGIPSYVNYINRAKQTEAMDALMQVKFDQEAFWAENFRYAGTIRCLASFGGDRCCIPENGCTASIDTSPWYTTSSYRIWVINADAEFFAIRAQRTASGQLDSLYDNSTRERPRVETPDALKWSIFKWIFG